MPSPRRYFRYDVQIAMHLEPVDRYGKHLGADRRQLMSEKEEVHLKKLNGQLDELLSKVFNASSNALYVFYALNHRINFMWWMTDLLMESNDPRQQNDYKFRSKEDRKFSPPISKKGSSIAPLIQGLYRATDLYITELQAVIQKSVSGKIFLYPWGSQEFFNAIHYVKNLDQLAESGVLPAQVLKLMIEKLNLQAMVLDRLKGVYRKISRAEEWPSYQVNLSCGGFSFLTNDAYSVFGNMDIFMEIDSEVMVCRGKIISQIIMGNRPFKYRIGVEFDLLTGEQAHAITLFLQHKEIKDAMATVALPF
jgi:hypothetical protein